MVHPSGRRPRVPTSGHFVFPLAALREGRSVVGRCHCAPPEPYLSASCGPLPAVSASCGVGTATQTAFGTGGGSSLCTTAASRRRSVGGRMRRRHAVYVGSSGGRSPPCCRSGSTKSQQSPWTHLASCTQRARHLPTVSLVAGGSRIAKVLYAAPVDGAPILGGLRQSTQIEVDVWPMSPCFTECGHCLRLAGSGRLLV